MNTLFETRRLTEGQTGIDVGRRNLLKLTGVGAAALGMMSVDAPPLRRARSPGTRPSPGVLASIIGRSPSTTASVSPWSPTCTFQRTSIARSGMPHSWLADPYGAVKEQASGLYAQTMAERGFITIAHDPSYVGESGGQPHGIASSEALVEDFSAAVDFLGGLPFVDRDRIGVIGVCGSGGFGLAAAEIDPASRRSPPSACTTSARRSGRVSPPTWTQRRSERTSATSRPSAGRRWMAQSGRW